MTLYQKEAWTIDQLIKYSTAYGERRTRLISSQQREGGGYKPSGYVIVL